MSNLYVSGLLALLVLTGSFHLHLLNGHIQKLQITSSSAPLTLQFDLGRPRLVLHSVDVGVGAALVVESN